MVKKGSSPRGMCARSYQKNSESSYSDPLDLQPSFSCSFALSHVSRYKDVRLQCHRTTDMNGIHAA